MSKTSKRKHVLRETNKVNDYFAPPSEGQTIVRILASKGNNLHEVEDADKQIYLVSMPTKFRKNIWVKRGDYVIVEPIKEGDKVKAEMVRVLSKEHIKYFHKINVWPAGFEIIFDRLGFQSFHSTSSTSSSSSEWSTETESESDSADDEVIDAKKEKKLNSGASGESADNCDQSEPALHINTPSDEICLEKIKIAPDDKK